MNTINLAESFQELIDYSFIRYKGILIEKVGKDFKVMGKTYPTEYLAKKSIDLSFKNFTLNKKSC